MTGMRLGGIFLWLLFSAPHFVCFAGPVSQDGIDLVLKDAETHLEKSAARRPFRFKGMNESLHWTLEAVRLLNSPEQPEKITAPPAWSSSSPLSPVLSSRQLTMPHKQALRFSDKARAAFSKNTFALALKAVVYQSVGQTQSAKQFWTEYVKQAGEYSTFDKEVLSSNRFTLLREYAENYLRSEGVDLESIYNEAGQRSLPEELWYWVTHPPPAEKMLNGIFIFSLAAGTVLLVLMGVFGVEFYKSAGFTLVVLYGAVWLAYGCWIVDLAYGLPGGVGRAKAAICILAAAVLICVYEAWTGWRDAHPQLEEGYQRCPHCKAVIVELSIECSACKKKINRRE